MLRFILTRLSLVIPTFFGMTLLAFFLIRLVPGDPIETMAGERGIDATRHAQLLKEYGLDKPVLVTPLAVSEEFFEASDRPVKGFPERYLLHVGNRAEQFV